MRLKQHVEGKKVSKLIINYNVQISEKISKLFETSESSWTPNPEVWWGKGGVKGERGGMELIICKSVASPCHG